MYRFTRFFVLCLLLVASLMILSTIPVAAQTATPMAPISLDSLHSRDLNIDLGDGWASKAQLTWPAQGKGPFPTVIVFHGDGGFDMDETQHENPGDPIMSANFRLLAQQLGTKGIAVLRFNRRGVKADFDFDNDQLGKSFTRGRSLADGKSVIAAALEQPEVDPAQLYLYGWSGGTIIASYLAVYHPELAGVILCSTLNDPSVRSALTYQWMREGVGYFQDTLDTNRDNKVSLDELKQTPATGPILYMMQGASFYSPFSTPEKPTLDPNLDKNSDGQIDIETEMIPYLLATIENISTTNPDRTLPTLSSVLAPLHVPVLLLAGENDGLVSPVNSQELADVLGTRATLRLYPGLGHSLSKTVKPAEDAFTRWSSSRWTTSAPGFWRGNEA